MSTVSTWLCPNCRRRVPATIDECRCGFLRVLAVRAATRRVEHERIPWEVWVALGAIALTMVLGVASLFLPRAKQPIVPILGYSTATPSPETKKPTPQR